MTRAEAPTRTWIRPHPRHRSRTRTRTWAWAWTWTWPRRAAALATAVVALVLAGSGAASAHPLGNFTVNSASVLRVGVETVHVDVVVDFAEIPTAQLRPDVDALGPARWQEAECARTSRQTRLVLDSQVSPLVGAGGSVTFPPGSGGLATMRLVCRYSAPTGGPVGEVQFRLAAYTDRIGWRETVAVGDGTTLLASDVPDRSPTDLLTRYPDDPLRGPSDVTSATLTVRPGGPAATDPLTGPAAGAGAPGTGTPGTGAAEQARRAQGGDDGLTGWVDGLVRRDSLTVGVALLALLAAFVLGTAHAFAPGHGKTVMAARIVGGSVTGRQLAATATAVTLTHTCGVLILAIVLSASSGFAPERIYPWLGVASGLLIAGIGASLLRSRLAGASGLLSPSVAGLDHQALAPAHTHHRHSHSGANGHGHGHTHTHGHGHGHGHGGRWHTHPHPAADGSQLRSLLAAGFAGGMVPTPSAIVVLLGAVALGRAWFGLLLVLAYGAGMALTLIGAGFLLDRTLVPLLRRVRAAAPGLTAGLYWAPVASAALIVVVGATVALRAGVQVIA
ncbi:High-affinity nickel-transport protein [Parafrankia irregularis]|uniref:High-affinity nickel-transport protein n=1 Tax=Parafrankia irregularis TaxID=795642 RepID=A0A0S4QR63_9ACTN|nr:MULTISPECIES: high frequency lysogenization protein HflD [Parafrankia]MBE3200620.1 high frequency lysogenization protein HflD [Parafrankia sp. CH37]CUU56954.1 High-affinity nickel-transport protein [Parafrankia irregularis]